MIREGLARHRQGDLGQAERLYREALARDPGSAEALHLLGLVAHATGHLDQAVQLFGQAIAIAPTRIVYHNNLGNALLSAKQPAKAAQCFERALSLDPDFAVGHNNLGLAMSAQGRFAEAAEKFRRATELQPALADAFGNLANALMNQGLMAEAETAAERAVAADPGNVDLKAKRIRVILARGRAAEAAALAEAVLVETPDQADLLTVHGLAMMQIGRPIRAAHDFARAARAAPHLSEASDRLREAVARQPADADLFAGLLAAHAQGRLEIGLDLESLRHPHAPLRVEFYANWALMLMAAGWAGAFWLMPPVPALATVAALTLAHVLFGRKLVARKMRAYALAKLASDPDLWNQVWNRGALTLRDPKTGQTAASPKDSWRLAAEDAGFSAPAR